MTDEEYLTWLQNSIHYNFQQQYLLQTTLITPGFEGDKDGSEEEEKKYQGNRILAQLGDSLVPLVVRHQVLFIKGASRSRASDTVKTIVGTKYQEERARFLGIKAHMKLNKRQNGGAGPTTLRLALCAIIGAVWLDCNNDYATTKGVVERLLIGPKLSPFVDPKALFSKEGGEIYPNNFDPWLRTPGTPCGIVPCNSLRITRDGGPSTIVLRASAARNIQEPTREHERDVDLGLVQNIPDPVVDLCLNPAFSPGSANNATTHFFHEQPVNASPETLSISTRLLPNDDEVDSIRPSESVVTVKKRKFPIRESASQTSISKQLRDYIRVEEGRWQNLGQSFSPNEFDLAMIAASPTLAVDDRMFAQLKMFYFAIGSAESLVALKGLIEVGRRSVAGKQPKKTASLSLLERMKIVEHLDSKIAYNIFTRRYHIYHFLVDSRATHQKTSEGFINNTMKSMSTKNKPQMGNPHNLGACQISKNILAELHPTLIPYTPEYDKKLKNMSKIRKLGERFEFLVEKFGYGIIGLIPLPGHDLGADLVFSAGDTFISSITDVMFKSLVQCLQHLKGRVLRDTSNAVSQVVRAVFEEKLSHSEIFAIERLHQSQILQHPGGSRELLRLIL